MTKNKLLIDKDWTLFLDRDGVINKKLEGEYVRNAGEFEFTDHALEAIARLSVQFNRIFIVTNQQGVGKGLMKLEDLLDIHTKMLQNITENNGRIDKIYYCTATREEESFFRKPGVGMALRARKDFPHIIFKKSIMVGDSITDMQFGKKLKMKTVFITNLNSGLRPNPFLIDYTCPDLLTLVNEIIDNPEIR